ncbi:MAG: hypothetical protein Q9169_007320 [Polycauliona sp. 2 TL-2023]
MAPEESPSSEDSPRLHQAAWNGNDFDIDIFVREGDDPRQVDDEGETALHQAAWQGHTDTVESLLIRGADPQSQSWNGRTPLHHAAGNGFKEVVTLLLEGGADPNTEDGKGLKPHQLAQVNAHYSTATLIYQTIHVTVSFSWKTRFPGRSHTWGIRIVRSSRVYLMPGHNFKSEFMSLLAINDAVPTLCPKPIKHGRLTEMGPHFLLLEFIDTTSPDETPITGESLAMKLARLHIAPTPTHHKLNPVLKFGFPFPTYFGGMMQPNPHKQRWHLVFTSRLGYIHGKIMQKHGSDEELDALIGRIIGEVVVRLLRRPHVGGRRWVKPALVHGGIGLRNMIGGGREGQDCSEQMILDPESIYAHSEYEIAMMRLSKDFPSAFFHEYHTYIPKTWPAEEYAGRMQLYAL